MFSVLTLLNFLSRNGGIGGFTRLMERLADPHRNEGNIARSLGMAPSQFSRMINQWTITVRVPRKDVVEFVNVYNSVERANLERTRETSRVYQLATSGHEVETE